MRRPGGAAPPPKRRPGAPTESESFGDPASEIRIACIDVGGGTTDLMIARYNFESKIDDSIRGAVLHQDGIALGGDQLVKRLLETIIVPAFAEAVGLEDEDIQFLFGPEVPKNREFRAQRVSWINRFFVPLAQVVSNYIKSRPPKRNAMANERLAEAEAAAIESGSRPTSADSD